MQLVMRMRVVVLLCLISLLCVSVCAVPAFADVRKGDVLAHMTVEDRGVSAALCPSIDAERAILVDGDGRVFFERDADTPQHIASVTKIMTAIVALEIAPLDTPVIVTSEAASIGESSAGLREGDILTLEMALTALLVSSGNDAAIAISDSLGALMRDGSLPSGNGATVSPSFIDRQQIQSASTNTEAFVMAMNAKAAELGMANSLFSNAHGLDIGSYDAEMHSTAREVAVMSAYAMKNEVFRAIVAQDGATITKTNAGGASESIELLSTDELIGVYEGACGIKTGYTSAAGYCFSGACERDGTYLFAVVLGSTSHEQRFDDAKALYSWYYGNWVDYSFANSEQHIPVVLNGKTIEAPVVAEVSHLSWLDKTVKATLEDPSATIRTFSFDGNISQKVFFSEVRGDVGVGDKVGYIEFYRHNELIATCNMVAAEAFAAPGPLETLGIAWKRFWLGIKGEQDSAPSVVLNETPLVYDKSASSAL